MRKLGLQLVRCFSATWGHVRMGARHSRLIAATARMLSLCLLMFAATQALARPKLSPELKHVKGGQAVDVIVQFTSDPTDEHIGKVTRKGALLKHKLSVIHGAAFSSLPAEALAQLEQDPDVAYISPDRAVQGSGLDYTPETVNAPWAWQQLHLDGTGVGVAVIDSGVYPVADLYWYNTLTGAYGLRVVYSQSFVPGTTDASDYYGHGTHVAGIVAGAGWMSYGNHYTHQFKGIAPNSNIINLRALDQNGSGTDSSVIAAIQTAINLKSQYNIRVINLSLGRQVYESYALDPLCQAVEAAWKAGIVVVAAAGNEGRNDSAGTNGYGTIAAPGNDPYVITVGAMNTANTSSRGDDTVASYSSKGPTAFDHIVKPDIVAPGNRVVSTLSPYSNFPKQYQATDVLTPEYVKNSNRNNVSTDYLRLSGTSMATAVVSGAVALMVQADPSLSPDTVKARLMKSASKQFPVDSTVTDFTTGKTYTDFYDIFTIGAGYLDIQAALNDFDTVPATLDAASPVANYDATSGNVYLTPSDGSPLWDSSIVWGNSLVWGSAEFSGTTLSGQSIIWGDSVVWGDVTQDGFSIVWGSTVIWGSSDQGNALSTLAGADN